MPHIKICKATWNMACLSHHCCHWWNLPPTTSLCSHPLFGLHKYSASISECQCVPFFLHGGIQFHTFASSSLPCQTPFCQIAPLLPSVAWQQNVGEYWWEGWASTAISTSASEIVDQHNKIEGITFRAALVHVCSTLSCYLKSLLQIFKLDSEKTGVFFYVVFSALQEREPRPCFILCASINKCLSWTPTSPAALLCNTACTLVYLKVCTECWIHFVSSFT